jgi:glycosyltransferase involved in cell wall biosynthesis
MIIYHCKLTSSARLAAVSLAKNLTPSTFTKAVEARARRRAIRSLPTEMKVLHLDHSIARGGAELALLRMLNAPHPWSASVFVPHRRDHSIGAFQQLREVRAVQIRECGPPQYSGASGSTLVGLVSFAVRAIGQSVSIRLSPEFKAADIIHANTSRSAVYAALACWGSRKTLIVHVRDLINEQSLGKMGTRLFSRFALARADGFIANSAATLDSIIGPHGPTQPSTIIASAFGHNKTNYSPLRTVKRIGMVARLDPWKGQQLLLNAFASEFRGSELQLVLAGGAPFGHELYERALRESAINLGIESQVEFLGHVDDVAALIASFDICVQSSLRPEPLGQNVLQYLSAGRPTVAVNAGGPAEWIKSGFNGLLFEMGSLASLRSALRSITSDEHLREQLSRRAAETPGLISDSEVAHLHSTFFRTVLAGA